jgi:predicted amidohydrolase YtcJ
MTHKYTLLVDAVVIPGSGAPDATAIAWAEDTVIAIGSDEDVASISRGDSHVFKLAGATVAPSVGGVLEVGGSADLDVTDNDPRASAPGDARLLAVVRGGKVVEGTLPGASGGHDHGHHDH